MTEEQPIVIEEEKSKPAWTLWIAAGGCVVFLCAAVFVGTLIFIGPQFVQQLLPDQVQVAGELPRVVTQSNTMGNPDAPVHIIEYGDFQCPYCLKFWSETEPQLIEEYVNTDQVYFEYRAYPIIGPESSWAAEGAYCAGDQGRFWEFHDTLFANWSGENVGDYTKENLVKYAKALDLNMAEFESCLSEEKHKGTVEQDAAAAEANGIHATPTFFINGFKVEGAQPYSILKDLIEQALDGNLDTQNG
ncbi:MAG: DsbA family protein [Anaerolineales bacterium]|nr:DsbA family protein [Anaerolineales bacterium]